jgi:nitric oxide reductase subunit B
VERLSIIALLGGIGLLLTYFGRYSSFLGWHVEENRRVRFRSPSEISLTPAQRATAWYFAVVAALFLVQTLLGGATAHYHAETGGFFGYDLACVLPYNLARTWHLQWGLFWVVASFLAAGIFLAPIITGSEPRFLTVALLAALVVVVVGSLAGEAASYKGIIEGSARPFL